MLQYTILDTVKRPFVIYKDTFVNQYCLEPRRGMTEKKAMIISLPRSGVHLMQEILCSFNMAHVRVSHEKDTIGDYRFLSDNDRIKFSRIYDSYALPIKESYKWLTNGQFTHNHMKYDDTTYCLLRDSEYLMYILKRNLRDCVVSHARQKQHDNLCFPNDTSKIMDAYIKMPYYVEITETVKLMLPWFRNKTFDEISFESISGKNGKDDQYRTILKLMEDFEIKNMTSDEIINKCVNKKTFTHSGELSDWRNYWNDDIEEWFVDTGLKKLNEELEYE